MVDPTLRMGIIAVSARHFANTGRSFDQAEDTSPSRFVNANVDALHFKRQAIKELSASLSPLEPSNRDAIMATILLLIFIDLLESGMDGWKDHLRGADSLVRLSHSLLESGASHHVNSDPGETVEETRRFIARQLLLYVASLLDGKGCAFSLTIAVSQPLGVHSQTRNLCLSSLSISKKAGIRSP